MNVKDIILKIQKEVKKVEKDGNNPHHNSKYPTLEGVLDVLNPHFEANQLLVTQFSKWDKEKGWVLETMLEAEDSRSYELPLLGLDVKNPMQGLGSAMTYGRRYSLMGIFKLSPTDDDANALTKKTEEKPQQQKPVQNGNGKSDMGRLVKAFATLNISQLEIEARYKKELKDLDFKQVTELKGIYSAIKNGKKAKADYFASEIDFESDFTGDEFQ